MLFIVFIDFYFYLQKYHWCRAHSQAHTDILFISYTLILFLPGRQMFPLLAYPSLFQLLLPFMLPATLWCLIKASSLTLCFSDGFIRNTLLHSLLDYTTNHVTHTHTHTSCSPKQKSNVKCFAWSRFHLFSLGEKLKTVCVHSASFLRIFYLSVVYSGKSEGVQVAQSFLTVLLNLSE